MAAGSSGAQRRQRRQDAEGENERWRGENGGLGFGCNGGLGSALSPPELEWMPDVCALPARVPVDERHALPYVQEKGDEDWVGWAIGQRPSRPLLFSSFLFFYLKQRQLGKSLGYQNTLKNCGTRPLKFFVVFGTATKGLRGN